MFYRNDATKIFRSREFKAIFWGSRQKVIADPALFKSIVKIFLVIHSHTSNLFNFYCYIKSKRDVKRTKVAQRQSLIGKLNFFFDFCPAGSDRGQFLIDAA